MPDRTVVCPTFGGKSLHYEWAAHLEVGSEGRLRDERHRKPRGTFDGVDPKAGGPRQANFWMNYRCSFAGQRTVPSGESASETDRVMPRDSHTH
jgi:hypothetical protein